MKDITHWGNVSDKYMLLDIQKWYRRLITDYEYGYVYNGQVFTDNKYFDNGHFVRNYRTLSVVDFEKYKVGICWDYARWLYTKVYLHYPKHNEHYQVKNYYFILNDAPQYPTHTITVIPTHKGYVYTEASWESYRDLQFWFDKQKLLDTVAARLIMFYGFRRLADVEVGCREYSDFNQRVGLSVEEFMHSMNEEKKVEVHPKFYKSIDHIIE